MDINKRVVQVSFDVICDDDTDGTTLAYLMARYLKDSGFSVVGQDFNEDVTEHYPQEVHKDVSRLYESRAEEIV